MNDNDLKKWCTQKTLSSCQTGKKVLILSLKEGSGFFSEELRPYVKKDQVVFLQIKTSLLSRLPFMDDLSKVLEDLRDLLDGLKSD